MPNFHSAMARRLSACSRKVHNLPLSDTSIHPVAAMNDGAPCGAAVIELLEKREMLSVSQNGGGWTVVTPSAGDRVIYVSSSQGSDHNSGLSSSSPVQSIARGESLLRNNSGDQLLLKRGRYLESVARLLEQKRVVAPESDRSRSLRLRAARHWPPETARRWFPAERPWTMWISSASTCIPMQDPGQAPTASPSIRASTISSSKTATSKATKITSPSKNTSAR